MEENTHIPENDGEGRRDFLKKIGIFAGVGVAAAAGAVYVASDYEERKHPEGKKGKSSYGRWTARRSS